MLDLQLDRSPDPSLARRSVASYHQRLAILEMDFVERYLQQSTQTDYLMIRFRRGLCALEARYLHRHQDEILSDFDLFIEAWHEYISEYE